TGLDDEGQGPRRERRGRHHRHRAIGRGPGDIPCDGDEGRDPEARGNCETAQQIWRGGEVDGLHQSLGSSGPKYELISSRTRPALKIRLYTVGGISRSKTEASDWRQSGTWKRNTSRVVTATTAVPVISTVTRTRATVRRSSVTRFATGSSGTRSWTGSSSPRPSGGRRPSMKATAPPASTSIPPRRTRRSRPSKGSRAARTAGASSRFSPEPSPRSS